MVSAVSGVVAHTGGFHTCSTTGMRFVSVVLLLSAFWQPLPSGNHTKLPAAVVVIPSQYLQVHVTRGIIQHVVCGRYILLLGTHPHSIFVMEAWSQELYRPTATGRLSSVRVICAAAVDA